MKFSGKQLEFESMYETEQDCIDYIELFRWKHCFVCPICRSIRYWGKVKGDMSV